MIGPSGAAGTIRSVACADAQGFVHPSINCEDVHPDVAAFAASIPHVMRETPDLQIAIKAGFGFGDVNACVIFQKWRGEGA
jgi:3-oxoacyl-(acyl-carrier-protein) synthase